MSHRSGILGRTHPTLQRRVTHVTTTEDSQGAASMTSCIPRPGDCLGRALTSPVPTSRGKRQATDAWRRWHSALCKKRVGRCNRVYRLPGRRDLDRGRDWAPFSWTRRSKKSFKAASPADIAAASVLKKSEHMLIASGCPSRHISQVNGARGGPRRLTDI